MESSTNLHSFELVAMCSSVSGIRADSTLINRENYSLNPVKWHESSTNTVLSWLLCVHRHRCQQSPEFVNLYFPYEGCFLFSAGGRGILNSNRHVWQWKEEAMLRKICKHNFNSRFRWDFFVYCTSPVSVQSVCIWWWHVPAAHSTVFQSFC